MDNIKIESTTDTKAEIDAALGLKQEVEETKSESSKEDESEQSHDESDTSENESEESEDDDESKDESESSEDDKKPRKKNGFKKRVERFQRRLSERDLEIERLSRELEMAKSSKKDDKPEDTNLNKNTESKPKAADFDTHEDYVEALTDWKIAKEKAAIQKEAEERTHKESVKKQTETFQSKVNDFKKEAKDFDEVIEDVDDIGLSSVVQKAILTSDIGPQLMYELAKNRENLERINSLDVFTALKEIGKIEDKVQQRLSSKTLNKQTTTKAPPPITPLNSKSSKVSKSPDEMSFDEYKAYRLSQSRKA